MKLLEHPVPLQISQLCVCVWVSEWVSEWVQSLPTLLDPMDCSPPGSSVHGLLQTRILGWVAISSSRGSSQPRDQTRVLSASRIGRQTLYHCATWVALSHLSTQGVIGAIQAGAAAPPSTGTTGAPPPSKQPLVSNGPPATVNRPAQPLVGAKLDPSPSLYIKAQILKERRFFERLICHLFDLLAFWL